VTAPVLMPSSGAAWSVGACCWLGGATEPSGPGTECWSAMIHACSGESAAASLFVVRWSTALVAEEFVALAADSLLIMREKEEACAATWLRV
jgi:hypothetical protein